MKRISGLNTLRFILALWVLMAHCGAPSVCGIFGRTGLIADVQCMCFSISGEAAVLVFFVISGLCIHFPFKDGQKPDLFPYYFRRNVRILIPCLIAILFAAYAGVSYFPLDKSNMWSIVCEELYYIFFPLFLIVKRRTSWRTIHIVTFSMAVAVILTNPCAREYHFYGNFLNPILGLPCWLLGARLAEEVDGLRTAKPPGHVTIWLWRLGMWILSSLAFRLNACPLIFAPGHPWTLTLFAPIVFLWLRREISFYSAHSPAKFLEWCGEWSYSVYLVHVPVAVLVALFIFPRLGVSFNWPTYAISILLGSWFFYVLVEDPAHRLSRRFKNIYLNLPATTSVIASPSA